MIVRARNQVDLEEFKRLYDDGYSHHELCGYFHVSTDRLSQIIIENGFKRKQRKGRPRKALVEKFKPIKPTRKPRNNEYACPVCGKVFYDYVGSVAGKWPYQRCINNRERKICTRSCVVKYDKLAEGVATWED